MKRIVYQSLNSRRFCRHRQLALAVALAVVAASTGCRFHRPIGPDKCANIKPGAMPAPTGTYTCQWQNAQAERAEAGKYVVQQCEWYMGGKSLGPDGRSHVDRIGKFVSQTPFPVVVARSDDDTLNEARRQLVVEKLVACGVEDANDRVIIERPEGEGLYGPEAVRYGSLRSLGISSFGGGAGGGGGGIGGGGMGGGGLGGGGVGGMGGGGMGGMGGGGMGMF
jgi:hypothetical protein